MRKLLTRDDIIKLLDKYVEKEEGYPYIYKEHEYIADFLLSAGDIERKLDAR